MKTIKELIIEKQKNDLEIAQKKREEKEIKFYEDISVIQNLINCNINKLDKMIAKEQKKQQPSVIIDGNVYHSIEEFENAWQSGVDFSFGAESKKYDRITDKLCLKNTEKLDRLNNIKMFLKYYTTEKLIRELFEIYNKKQGA